MIWFERIRRWVEDHPEIVWGATAASGALLVIGLVALPLILLRLRADYFVREEEEPASVVTKVLRNIFGAFVLVAGVALLALPGQGLLTIFAGLLLIDFPGKRRLALALLRREGVRRWVDWIREKGDKPKLELPDDAAVG